ncbi:MAG: methyl-accepting chemotaxis protein [Clostridiales bacterium]|nr:methyl-accepting chemotaxis protein [Clostridiales bacterium]
MTIRKKVLFGFILVAVVGVITGIVGLGASSILTRMSRELDVMHKESVGISEVLNAHFVWRQGLTETVMTGADFTGSLDPSACAFGRWTDSEVARNLQDQEIRALLSKITEPHDLIHHEAQDIVAYIRSGNTREAREHLTNIVLPKTQEVINLLSSMENRYTTIMEGKSVEIEKFGVLMNAVILALIGVALAISCILAWFITKSIVKPLVPLVAYMTKASTYGDISLSAEDQETIKHLSRVNDEIGKTIKSCADFVGRITNVSKVLETVAAGDMTSELSVLSDQDVIGNSLDQMSTKLNDMFVEIHQSSEQVSTGSKQVADGAQSLAQGSTEQAASIEELSSSIAEIAEKIKANAELAEQANKLADLIKDNAERGSQQMDEMIEAVNEINEASGSISKVIKVIDDIAFQTNILALNAAVEAARAGAAGKGFAVVAEEVRNLAAKSAAAAKDTGSLIENSIEKANLGVRIAGETAASLTEIVTGINESSHIVEAITEASEKQALDIIQINSSVDQVAQVVQHNSATAQESAAASEEMSSQSDMLRTYISQFKLKQDSVAHGSSPEFNRQMKSSPAAPLYDYMLIAGADNNGKY